MCHYLAIFSDFRSIHACMMYLLHTILSEYQQVFQYASSGRRVKFCRQYKCFNPTPLHPRPSTPTLVFYASCSIHVFPFPPVVHFLCQRCVLPKPEKMFKSLCQLVCVCVCVCKRMCMQARFGSSMIIIM